MARAKEARAWARGALQGIGDLGHQMLWCTSGVAEFWSLTIDERKRLLEVAIDVGRSANEDTFTKPFEFDVAREPNKHVAFGYGVHPTRCSTRPGTTCGDGTVYYLNAFPGKAFKIEGADANTFQLLDRPGFAKDRNRVFHRDHAVSADPAHFEFLSTADQYLFTKNRRTVHGNGNRVAGADLASLRTLDGPYAQDGTMPASIGCASRSMVPIRQLSGC